MDIDSNTLIKILELALVIVAALGIYVLLRYIKLKSRTIMINTDGESPDDAESICDNLVNYRNHYINFYVNSIFARYNIDGEGEGPNKAIVNVLSPGPNIVTVQIILSSESDYVLVLDWSKMRFKFEANYHLMLKSFQTKTCGAIEDGKFLNMRKVNNALRKIEYQVCDYKTNQLSDVNLDEIKNMLSSKLSQTLTDLSNSLSNLATVSPIDEQQENSESQNADQNSTNEEV